MVCWGKVVCLCLCCCCCCCCLEQYNTNYVGLPMQVHTMDILNNCWHVKREPMRIVPSAYVIMLKMSLAIWIFIMYIKNENEPDVDPLRHLWRYGPTLVVKLNKLGLVCQAIWNPSENVSGFEIVWYDTRYVFKKNTVNHDKPLCNIYRHQHVIKHGISVKLGIPNINSTAHHLLRLRPIPY